MSDYDRIARAISYISDHVSEQPTLDDIAAHLHLSPFHFQRLFCRWAGVTPKRFLQVLTVEQGKSFLRQQAALLDVAHSLGLTSASRLHDHFVQLESVTPGEYKKRGEGLSIAYGVHATPFGDMFVAVTERGVCRAAFLHESGIEAQLGDLKEAWPLAVISEKRATTRAVVSAMFDRAATPDRPLSLHVAGTNFQVAVWKALLRIPPGATASYSQVARAIGRPRAQRAVGSAIGANPIAFLIPCHRVIRESGALGAYRWGTTRKRAIQIWEEAQSVRGRT